MFRYEANLPAVGDGLRRNRALHGVVVAVVGVTSRIGTADLCARSVIACFALSAGARANRGRALLARGARAVITGCALRTSA